MIQIIPAIDIIEGRCVRLTKGDYGRKKVYDAQPDEMAALYADCGVSRIHLVDLDGARISAPANLRTLEKIAGRVNIELEWGGGIADDGALCDVFSAGATQAIIGSAAVRNPGLLHAWLKRHGAGAIILGADVRDGKVAVNGWQEDSELSIADLMNRFRPDGLSQAIVTDISRDGMMQGPTFKLYTDLQTEYPEVCFTVSGGISSMADIEKLNGMGLQKVIVGKAIYENRITTKDIERWSQNV